jgi:hypothetical protein
MLLLTFGECNGVCNASGSGTPRESLQNVPVFFKSIEVKASRDRPVERRGAGDRLLNVDGEETSSDQKVRAFIREGFDHRR